MSHTTITYETARGASIDAAMSALVGLWATIKTAKNGKPIESLIESYDEKTQILWGTIVIDGLPIGQPWSAHIDEIVSIEV